MNAYATVDEFKATDNMRDTDFDDKIQEVLDAAAETINNFCHRPDGFVAGSSTTRLYAGDSKPWLYVGEVVEVSNVEIKVGGVWTALSTDDYVATSGDPERPDFNMTPFSWVLMIGGLYATFVAPERPLPNVRVTAKWGYSLTVPAVIKTATIAQASRWFKRGQSKWADTLASNETGQLVFSKTIDPDIAMMLMKGRLIRPAIG